MQDKYTSGGWTQHHAHMLKYEETSAENPEPSISVSVTEPANDKEKDWQVTIISAVPVSYMSMLSFSFKLFDLHCSSLFCAFVLFVFASLYITV